MLKFIQSPPNTDPLGILKIYFKCALMINHLVSTMQNSKVLYTEHDRVNIV